MNKSLKERIIGATVLVAVAVLVVPVFLDGPPSEEEMVSERVPLPGQSEQKSQTVVLDRDRDEPVPAQVDTATETAAVAGNSPPPQPTPAEPQETSAPQPTAAEPVRDTEPEPTPERELPAPVQAASSTTGMWAVQVGAFASADRANAVAAELRKQGFAAFLSQLQTDSGQLHRVRVGPQKDREAAEAMAARLQKAGHDGKVLPHP